MAEDKNKQQEPAREKTRYSDDELKEFKDLILKKLEKARKELDYLQEAIKNNTEHGGEDKFNVPSLLEEGSATLEKEQLSQLAERQRKFIKNLEDAMVRIESKTYGICKVTGKLINKERLKAVPHTTMSIEAKNNQ